MATREDRYRRRFLKCADLKGKPVRLTIAAEYSEKLKDTTGKEEEKSILSFVGTDKELVVNVTNWDSIVEVTSESDSENWAGHKIELYPTTTPMGGKTVDCIRICAPRAAPRIPAA